MNWSSRVALSWIVRAADRTNPAVSAGEARRLSSRRATARRMP